MAKKRKPINSVGGLVFKSIWLAFALLMYGCGMYVFIDDTCFGMWMMWGAFCALPQIWTIIRNAYKSTREGAIEGSHQYTVSASSSGVSVDNHPIRGAIIGLIVSIFISLLFGPVVLVFSIVDAIIEIVRYSIKLAKVKKVSENN